MKSKKINWKKVTYWEKLEWGNPNAIYFSRLDIWKLPMWTFHFLRKVIAGLRKLEDFIRVIIVKNTDSYDIQNQFKFRNLDKLNKK